MLMRLERYVSDERGSFTIEGTLVFPIIFILTVGVLFLSMFIYQQVTLYTAATQAAERSALTWDNSFKILDTGAYVLDQRDGLYWRMFDDSISDVFQWIVANESTVVEFDSDSVTGQHSLAQKKLRRIEDFLANGVLGKATYSNHLFDRKVTVQLYSYLFVPSFLRWLVDEGWVVAEASSRVSDPVEFIRIIDLVRNYIPQIQHVMTPKDMMQTLEPFRNRMNKNVADEDRSFRSHDEAMRYLQKLVNGKESRETTETAGKWRMIDALDEGGIAHQAYYGQKTLNKDMREQMAKDIEIMGNGKVNGVVWHFFIKRGDGRYGPNEPLRKELERNGILVVIHQ